MSTTSPERRLYRLGLFLSLLATTVAGLALGPSCHARQAGPDMAAVCLESPPGALASAPPGALVSASDTTLANVAGGPELAPGARVVGRWQDAFWEATVVAVQGDLIVVAWDQPPPEISYRPRGWVVRADEPAAAAAVGDWLLCRSDRVWHLCQVESGESGDGDALRVVAISDARSYTMQRADTLPVPAGLVSWAMRHGAAALERARLAARLQSVEPAMVGKPARVRDRVLARWTDGSWWEAEVTAVSGAQTTVAWADGSAPMGLPPAHVAPLKGAPLARGAGELALCKWGESTRWWAAYIDTGAAGLEVAYADGTREPLREQCVTGRTSGN
jgi:hypothetical protein